MATCLVTGGAGYIGGMTTKRILDRGHRVVILDNLFRGHEESLDPRAEFRLADIRDRAAVKSVMEKYRPDCVLHFGALAYVGESFDLPELYFDVNINGSMNLLSVMVELGVKNFVFSSSCTVYGEPDRVPITEELPIKDAVSPYGQSKLAVEQLAGWLVKTGKLNAVCLRYFNAAGATENHGEDHVPETHLIPLAIGAALGTRPGLNVFGNDYETRDGTCIRDYIHIIDLADAHVLAMEKLVAGVPLPTAINLGSETGTTVMEVIKTVGECAGTPVPYTMGPRRDGDAPALVASSSLAREALGWNPSHSSITEIVETALAWHKAHPNGY